MPKATMPIDHPSPSLVIAGQRVERGKPVDVDDETAASLAEQGWSIAADDDTTKDDLLAIAAEAGVEVKPSWSKQKIADAISEASQTDASTDADPKES